MSDRWWAIDSDERSGQSPVIGFWLFFGQHAGEEDASVIGAGAGAGEEGKEPIWPRIIRDS